MYAALGRWLQKEASGAGPKRRGRPFLKLLACRLARERPLLGRLTLLFSQRLGPEDGVKIRID